MIEAIGNIPNPEDKSRTWKKYEGKTIKVEGEITQECPTGRWFHLKKENSLIFVNLHPAYFSIPQAVGHTVVAEGRLLREGPRLEIVGSGVEVK